MIQRFELAGIHFDLDRKVSEHAASKLATLDRYLPRHARESAHIEVRIVKDTFTERNQYLCEASLYVPRKTYVLHERGTSAQASIDSVSIRLKQQIRKYKEEFASGKQHRRTFARFYRQSSLSMPGF
jgi:ribosomal subunit interface protein